MNISACFIPINYNLFRNQWKHAFVLSNTDLNSKWDYKILIDNLDKAFDNVHNKRYRKDVVKSFNDALYWKEYSRAYCSHNFNHIEWRSSSHLVIMIDVESKVIGSGQGIADTWTFN